MVIDTEITFGLTPRCARGCADLLSEQTDRSVYLPDYRQTCLVSFKHGYQDDGTRRTDRRSARERLLAAADELFYEEGVHTVGIDRVIERAGVAKATLYSIFGSKDELIRAYLKAATWPARQRMARRWRAMTPPRERLLAVFDVLARRSPSRLPRLRVHQRQRRGPPRAVRSRSCQRVPRAGCAHCSSSLPQAVARRP